LTGSLELFCGVRGALIRGVTALFSLSLFSFFSGGSTVGRTPPTDLFLSLFWLFLLLEEPGGLPGPLLTGTVVLGGGAGTAEDTGGVGPDLVSSFSDLRLMGVFVGLTGKGVEDSLMMCPSMMCVRTWGLTTALGGTATVGSGSDVGGAGAGLGGGPTGVICRGGPLMLGGPRLGIGGLISLVSMGGPLSVVLVRGWMGATVEVGRGVAVDI